MKSAQLGGTIIIVIFAAVSMVTGPIHFLYVQASETAAESWLAQKMGPVLRSVPILKKMFPEKSRLAKNTDQRRGTEDGSGLIEAVSQQSENDLAQVSRPKQAQDDLSKWTENKAGDPEKQADARSKAYKFAKILKVSTPLLLPDCKIARNYKNGTQEEFEVPCPHCDGYQALKWENFVDNIDEKNLANAHFSCIHCGGEIHAYHRSQIMPRGKFVARNPSAMQYHRSFYLWTAYSPLQTFEGIAREWIDARGIPSAEQVFRNQELGLPYEPAGESAKAEELIKRSEDSHYDLGTIPAGYYHLVYGIDCQENRVEWKLVAYGRNVRRAVIQTGIINHHISEDEAKLELKKLVERRWRNFAGHYLPVVCTAIDGNAWRDDVGAWVQPTPADRNKDWYRQYGKNQVIMVRGKPDDAMPPIAEVLWEYTASGKRKRNRYRGRFFHFNVNSFKASLYRSLNDITDPLKRAYVDFPRGLGLNYFEQVASEKRIKKISKTGYVKHVWTKDPNQPNEALDMFNQAEAAARRSGVFDASDEYWDDLEAKYGTAIEVAQMDLEDMLLPPPRKLEQPVATLDGALEPEAVNAKEPSKTSPIMERMAALRKEREKQGS